MICVMGGLGNMIGGFLAAFVFSMLIAVGGYFAELEWGYVMAFIFFIAIMFARPQGLFARKS
jgi:branched-chain amino acid transport system permease protein